MSRNYTAGSTLHLGEETFELPTAREAVMYLKRAVRDGAEAVADMLYEAERGPLMCECELDWNCPLHQDQMYTAQERINDRYASEQTALDARYGF